MTENNSKKHGLHFTKYTHPLMRILRYWYLKVMRQSGGPDVIAAGVALGFFVGFVAPVGTQIFVILFLALFFKFNRLLALTFIWITNPWTVPFMYPLLIKLGSVITGLKVDVGEINLFLKHLPNNIDLSHLLNQGSKLVLNFFMGAFFVGIIFSVISYFLTYRYVIRHREHKVHRIKLRELIRKRRMSSKSSEATNK